METYGNQAVFSGRMYAGNDPVPSNAPTSPVMSVLMRAVKAQAEASERLVELARRIEPVMSYPTPEGCSIPKATQAGESPVEQALLEHAERLEALCYTLSTLIGRVRV